MKSLPHAAFVWIGIFLGTFVAGFLILLVLTLLLTHISVKFPSFGTDAAFNYVFTFLEGSAGVWVMLLSAIMGALFLLRRKLGWAFILFLLSTMTFWTRSLTTTVCFYGDLDAESTTDEEGR